MLQEDSVLLTDGRGKAELFDCSILLQYLPLLEKFSIQKEWDKFKQFKMSLSLRTTEGSSAPIPFYC